MTVNSVFRVLLIAMVALASTNSMAHSMEDVEASLNEKERYAQFVDQPAPEFDLTGVDGNTLSLADLNGKTVVLNCHGPGRCCRDPGQHARVWRQFRPEPR